MTKSCDCLNDCGDDPDVTSFKVEPCEHFVKCRKRVLAKLHDELLLKKIKVLLNEGRLPPDIQEYLQN